VYIYMTCHQNIRQEHDTTITNEYSENTVEFKYLLMSERNCLSPEYKTAMLPTMCYEVFKGQQQLGRSFVFYKNQYRLF
jgi:hypothetical protein